ncbi:iron-sulfur cluster assembly scaffold protein [Rhizorhapis suberifaciens]|uniref:NifU-like protein involved in Fe-S cluster formation n=1 Tax=Rhizorhapis suberifaciens TaxID=13656 RepID=A0A840HVL5_9SPHN|nr:iron-sulfur cluster assembly scaffold protein [Rhizorhapis suberifaciens]MBB4642003.1 NifU-like protein involved in Fe-S cluster formation [Rhizorhapis suberifaciens]
MNAPLYNSDILRLAASIPHHKRLKDPQGSAEKRSPTCGSRVTVDVRLDRDGRLCDLGLEVRACALGQASASLMAAHAMGKTQAELVTARDGLAAWLAGISAETDFWPGFEVIAPARGYPARHASIRLGFEAVAEAVAIANEHSGS